MKVQTSVGNIKVGFRSEVQRGSDSSHLRFHKFLPSFLHPKEHNPFSAPPRDVRYTLRDSPAFVKWETSRKLQNPI